MNNLEGFFGCFFFQMLLAYPASQRVLKKENHLYMKLFYMQVMLIEFATNPLPYVLNELYTYCENWRLKLDIGFFQRIDAKTTMFNV